MKRCALSLTMLACFAASAALAQTTPPPTPTDSTAARMPAAFAPGEQAVPAAPPAYIPPPPTETAAPIMASPQPQRPWLVPRRPETGIRVELDQQKQRILQSNSDLLEARKSLVEDKAMLEIKQHEIEALNIRIKEAKKAKNDDDRKAREAERKRQQVMADYFDHAVAMDGAAIDDVSARLDHAKVSVTALDLELQYALRMAGANPASDPQLLPLEQQVVQAQKDRASAQESLAKKDQAIADRRLKLYHAWVDYIGGK